MLRSGLLSLLLFLVSPLPAQLHTPQYFSQYTQGTGWSLYYTDILIGDINLDTVPDVIFTMAEGYQVGYGRLKDDRISFDMQRVDYYRHGWWYYKGQLIDYDLDGDLDFLTASTNNFDYSGTYIIENEGGQLVDTFRPAFPEFPAKTILYFSKFNSDDIDDVLHHVTEPLDVKLQDGATGEFQALPFTAYNISSRDFNHDGLMDFHQTSANSPVYHTQTDIIYLNQGDYTFSRIETPGFLSHPAGLASPPWGDFDGDGMDDQFAKPLFMSGLSLVFKSRMNNEGAARYDTIIISPAQPEEPRIVRDMTGDGTEDLILFTQDSLFWLESDDNMQFNVYGWPGQFHPGLIRTHPDLPEGTMIAMTYDGLPLLLHVSYDQSTGLKVEEDYNDFSPYVICESIYSSPMTHADVDADGQPELCVVAQHALAFAELQPDQSLEENYIQAGFNDFAGRAVSSGDWNGDGYDDLFLCEANSIYVATRQPDSTWSERNYLTAGLLFEAKDFDRNGFADLLIGIIDSIFILYNDQGTFTHHEVLPYHWSYPEYNIIDPNGDGYPDVALSGDSTAVFMNLGDGTFYKGDAVIPGKLARNTVDHSPYVFTVLYQDLNDIFYYRPNLFRISPDGHSAAWVAGHTLVNTVINNRESWLVNYDGDSIPDLLYNMQWVDSLEWQAVLINQEEAVYAVLSVPNSFILGAEDAAEDGAAEVLYVKGSIAYLEIGIPLDVSSTEGNHYKGPDVKIYPNPLSPGNTWTLSFENDFLGTIMIDIVHPDGQLLRHHEVEKTQREFLSTFEALPGTSGAVLVRISDATGSVVKKVIVIGK